jgi:hypothetical protein
MSTTAAPTGTASPAAGSADVAVRPAPLSKAVANANANLVAMECRIGSLLFEVAA